MTGTDRQEEPRSRWAERLAERREAYQQRGRLYKAGFITAGALVTLAGVVMLVTPGPALVIIPIGLAMLAMQFAWAERLLERALLHAERAQATAKEASPLQKAMTVGAALLIAAAVVAAIFYWDIAVPVINPD